MVSTLKKSGSQHFFTDSENDVIDILTREYIKSVFTGGDIMFSLKFTDVYTVNVSLLSRIHVISRSWSFKSFLFLRKCFNID